MVEVDLIYSVGKRGGSKRHWRIGNLPACQQQHRSGRFTGSGFVHDRGEIECDKCRKLYAQLYGK